MFVRQKQNAFIDFIISEKINVYSFFLFDVQLKQIFPFYIKEVPFF